MDDDYYVPITLEHGLNHVTFEDDGKKYLLDREHDIIIYEFKNGEYQEFGPFKNVEQTRGQLEKVINNLNDKVAGDLNDLIDGKIKLYIKPSDFYEKYGDDLKKYSIEGGKRYKKSRRKYSNKRRKSRKQRKQRKYSNKRRRY